MEEVSADKSYLSDANLRRIEEHGAHPFVPFKSNTTGQGSPMWRRLFAYFIGIGAARPEGCADTKGDNILTGERHQMT